MHAVGTCRVKWLCQCDMEQSHRDKLTLEQQHYKEVFEEHRIKKVRGLVFKYIYIYVYLYIHIFRVVW